MGGGMRADYCCYQRSELRCSAEATRVSKQHTATSHHQHSLAAVRLSTARMAARTHTALGSRAAPLTYPWPRTDTRQVGHGHLTLPIVAASATAREIGGLAGWGNFGLLVCWCTS